MPSPEFEAFATLLPLKRNMQWGELQAYAGINVVSPAYARTLLIQGKLGANAVISAGLRVVSRYPVVFLPEGAHFHGPLEIPDNPALCLVGNSLRVDGSMLLYGCLALTEIGSDLLVDKDCDLSGCTSLKKIGRNIKIGRELNLSSCSPEIELPESGVIGENLILPYDYDMARLPEALEIKGDVLRGTIL
jgi:hypothetical protein